MAAVLELEAFALDVTPLEGDAGWCSSCALPSMLVVDWTLVLPTTLRSVGRFSTVICADCHGPGS